MPIPMTITCWSVGPPWSPYFVTSKLSSSAAAGGADAFGAAAPSSGFADTPVRRR
ncbi:hypothetical protein V2I01_05155 [Micromonospora sp. BRA006-A]|nr:hypothetical protein [Micromonospora sp. BRA006-A]